MAINNVSELRTELGDIFDKLKAGTIPVQEAEALTNIAGKMISSSLAQVKYYESREEFPEIHFLADDRPKEVLPE